MAESMSLSAMCRSDFSSLLASSANSEMINEFVKPFWQPAANRGRYQRDLMDIAGNRTCSGHSRHELGAQELCGDGGLAVVLPLGDAVDERVQRLALRHAEFSAAAIILPAMLNVVAAALRGAQRGALSAKHGNKHYFKGTWLHAPGQGCDSLIAS